MKNNTLEYRVCQLENRFDEFEEKLDKIRTNELPHLQAAVDSLSTKIMVLTGVNLTAIIIGILAAKLIK